MGRRRQGSPSGQFKPGEALPRRGPGHRSPSSLRRLEKGRRPRNWNCVRLCTLAQEPTSPPLLSPNFPETPKSKHCRTSPQWQRDGSEWKPQPHGCLCYRPGPRELKQHPVVAACGPAARPGWCLPGSSLAPAELRAAVKPTPYPRLGRYTAASRDSSPWPGAASELPVTSHLAQALPAPFRHFLSLPRHSSPTVPTGVSPATRRLFATEPGSPTPPRRWMIHHAPYLEVRKSPPLHWPRQ